MSITVEARELVECLELSSNYVTRSATRLAVVCIVVEQLGANSIYVLYPIKCGYLARSAHNRLHIRHITALT